MASDEIEDKISRMLLYGVLLASALCSIGLLFEIIDQTSDTKYSLATGFISAGVLVLLFTPVVRVILLCLHYMQVRDHNFILITLFVMVMMVIGYIVGF